MKKTSLFSALAIAMLAPILASAAQSEIGPAKSLPKTRRASRTISASGNDGKRYGNNCNHAHHGKPHQGVKEIERRRLQIERGQLRTN